MNGVTVTEEGNAQTLSEKCHMMNSSHISQSKPKQYGICCLALLWLMESNDKFSSPINKKTVFTDVEMEACRFAARNSVSKPKRSLGIPAMFDTNYRFWNIVFVVLRYWPSLRFPLFKQTPRPVVWLLIQPWWWSQLLGCLQGWRQNSDLSSVDTHQLR